MKTYIYRIHPGIGIARLGNHPDAYFLGPEAPGIPPTGPYKSDGLVKRQGVRFRVFRYTYTDGTLSNIREIKNTDAAQIHWSTHLVNKKAAAGIFPPDRDGTLRNTHIVDDRFQLTIDSGNQSISGASQSLVLTGTFKNSSVDLGNLRTDEDGRLIVLGGFGTSRSVPPGQPVDSSFNNDDWCDDTSDGPVTATVEISRGVHKGLHQTDSAWIVVAPPSFAPGLYNVVTWYDRALVTALGLEPSGFPNEISFKDHVLPILTRTARLQWVDTLAAGGHSSAKPRSNFLDPGVLLKLASNDPASDDERRWVYESVDDPDNSGNFGGMPWLNGGLDPDNPVPPNRIRSQLTSVQRRILREWKDGKFVSDLPNDGNIPEPRPLSDYKDSELPDALDQAALDDSIGLAFYPGIESGFIMARSDSYDRPFRISRSLSAGDLTAGLAVPWQADFNACGTGQPYTWWPAARPNSVFTEGRDGRHEWVPAWFTNRDMVEDWWKLGFIVRQQDDRFVEIDRGDLDLLN